MRIQLRRPSPALVIACIALFVSMGGVSWAVATGSIDGREIRNGTITTKDLRNNEVRGADIRNSTIGGRDVALNTLSGNDIKESTLAKVPSASQADSAGSAGNAGNANTLGGVGADGFVRKEAPVFTALTLTGGDTGVDAEPPGYDVDGNGYVHLQGSITDSGEATFTLPIGARPATTSRFVVRQGATTAILTITAAGAATVPDGGGAVSLDGVTFAAAQ